MDNLLLTHGWVRFSWTKILNNEFPSKTYSDKNRLVISGRVVDEKNKLPITTGQLNIFLEAEDSTTQTLELTLDEKGSFKKEGLVFLGKAKLYYSYIDQNGKARPALVELDDYTQTEKTIPLIPSSMLKDIIAKNFSALNNKNEVDARFRNVQTHLEEIKELERVTILAKTNMKPIDKVNEKYTSGVFRSPGKVNLDNINEPGNDRSMNVADYIKNRIQQLEIQGGTFVNRKNFSLMSGQKWLVGIFIDEIPADINQLRIMRVDDVALVKFYEAGFVGVGSGSPGGALAVYRKEKSNKDIKPDKLEFVDFQGYSISKEFYQPNYNESSAHHRLTDNRSTIYWNPDIYTDAESKSVKFNFFNNDFSKKFKIVIEGFDAAGRLIHLEKVIGND